MGYYSENPQYSDAALQEIAREFPPVWASGSYADGYRQALLDAANAVNSLTCPYALDTISCARRDEALTDAHRAVLALFDAAALQGGGE